MLNEIRLENILFIDIETVPQYESFAGAPDTIKDLWDKKSGYFRKENESAEEVYSRAGIYAEFGRIICISAGIFSDVHEPRKFRIKSFYGDDEKHILSGFNTMVSRFSSNRDLWLCAHNGRDFDFPYLTRRMLINRLRPPQVLDVAGKKPWEVRFLDTMELWKFGEYRHYSSLDLLAQVFAIPNPKDEMDGSMIAKVYYADKDLSRIVAYCEKDVLTVAQLFLCFKGEPLISDENVEIVTGANN